MSSSKRLTAIVLAFVIVFTVLSSALVISLNSHHCCTGEACHICIQLSSAERTLKKLISASALAIVISAAAVYLFVITIPLYKNKNILSTLVSLRIELLN